MAGLLTASTLHCPQCGALVEQGIDRCGYCQAPLHVQPAEPRGAEGRASPVRPPIDPKAGEFGLRGKLAPVVGLGGAAIVYAAGWLYEDTRYWLADEAVAIWAGALPLWLFAMALSWRPRWGAWLAAIAIGFGVAACHLGIMASLRARLNDDFVGISAAFGGAALAGFALGRVLHGVIRRTRARAGIGAPGT